VTDHVDEGGVGSDTGRLRSIRPRDLAVRFAFGAAVSVVAGIVGFTVGEPAGGVLLAFPAILPAALTLIESREGTSTAVSDVRGAVVGALGMLGFAVAVVVLSGRIPVLVALLVATVTWAALSPALYFGGTRIAGVLGEQRYLPDVAVAEAVPAVEALRHAGLTVAVAETCSGGVLCALLSAVPGASDAVRGGVVIHAVDVERTLLDVPAEILEKDTVEAAACAMAERARRLLNADVGLSVAGATDAEPARVRPIVVAAVAPSGARTTRIEGDEGPEANTGKAVRDALRLCVEVLRGG